MEIACLGWCFPLTIPWGNTLTIPWQYTGNTLAVPWQYTGNTQALGRVWMCEISPLTVTSLEHQQCMGSCQLLEKKRKEKTTPFGVNLMRSQVLYRAAQLPILTWDAC